MNSGDPYPPTLMELDLQTLRSLTGHPSYWVPGELGGDGDPRISLIQTPDTAAFVEQA